MTNPQQEDKPRHDFDDDGTCMVCGFDGTEWWHWKNRTYEGRASDARMPYCEPVLFQRANKSHTR